MFHQKCEVFADMMLNTSVICLLKWLSDKFLTISLNILANPCGQLPTVSVSFTKKACWGICPKCQEILAISWQNLDHLPRILTNVWPTLPRNSRQSAKNTDNFLASCREIQDHMPRNPGPYAEKPWIICQECQQILGHLPRLPRTICWECQQILGHLPRLPRTAIELCLPRMPSLPWLALAAGSFGSLGSR